MQMTITDKELVKHLYKMPWKRNDNPNGWVEVTTYCQLKCPGCYRRLDKPDVEMFHEPPEKIIAEIDRHVRERNAECISIAGGEPLLYPHLPGILKYIRSRGCYSLVFTNAVALNDEKMEQLNNCGGGVITFLAHVADYQGLEMTAEERRKELVRKIKEYPNLRIAFTQIMTPDTLNFLPQIMAFDAEYNRDITFHLFTLMKNLADDQDEKEDKRLTSLTTSDMVNSIRHFMPYQPCAYLPTKENPERIGWLLTIPVYYQDKIIGFFDPELMQYVCQRYYKRKGKFAYVHKTNTLKLSWIMELLKFKSMRTVYANYLKAAVKNPFAMVLPTFHLILFVKPAEKAESGKWNLCDGCPDAMFYNDRLVPSCILEHIKRGGDIQIAL